MPQETKEAKHTPGPWELQLANSGARIVQSANATGPKANVVCSGLAGNRANATLIAAAPDLLAAINLMLVSLEKDGPASAIAVLNTHGREAVRKATGAA